MFCDADDWLMLDAMEILYRIASKHDADVVEFQFKEVMKIEEKTTKTDLLEKYLGEADIPTAIEEKIKYDILEFGEDDKNRKEYLISCSDHCGLGAIDKFYRLSMIQDNNIRFAEHLICEEPSFTMPVRIYERKHVLIYAELYCYFQSENSTMRSSWNDRKFDNIKVWMIILQNFEERKLFEKYHNELEYMFFAWGFGLSIRMLVARGYKLSEEELNFFKSALLRLFPNVLSNPYVVERKTDGWKMLLASLLEMELTKENVPEVNRIMRFYLEEKSRLLSQ